MESQEHIKYFPLVGKKAPSFKSSAWTGINFKEICLSDYTGKYLLLKFYLRNYTKEAISEIKEFNDQYDNFTKLSKSLLLSIII